MAGKTTMPTDAELRRLTELFGAVGSAPRLTILLALHAAGRDLGGDELIGRLGHLGTHSRSGLSHQLTLLCMVGLVERVRDERRVDYSLTDEGRALVAAVAPLLELGG